MTAVSRLYTNDTSPFPHSAVTCGGTFSPLSPREYFTWHCAAAGIAINSLLQMPTTLAAALGRSSHCACSLLLTTRTRLHNTLSIPRRQQPAADLGAGREYRPFAQLAVNRAHDIFVASAFLLHVAALCASELLLGFDVANSLLRASFAL